MTSTANTGYSKDYDAFWRSQIEPLGVTEENNRIKVFNPEAEPPIPAWGETKIFSRDQHGNLKIMYWTVDGELIVYYNDKLKNPKPIEYHTLRLADPVGDMKYRMPSKSEGSPGALPWFHPITVEAFRNSQKIDTIYLTEGVKKAWMGGQYGLHVVGLASITCYAGKDGKIHRDIRRLIEQCQVDNVVILWDGDCLDVSRKGIQVREEATRRPFGFFNAAKKIRKLILKADWEKPRSAPRIFFSHINTDSFPEERPKGLDDLLIVAGKKQKGEQVAQALSELEEGQGYFYKIEISSTTDLLFKHFALDDATKFYHRHADIIGEQEFYFRGDMYHYSEHENKLQLLQPQWAKSIYWIGDEFFEDITIPSAHQTIEQRTLVHRKKETLTARYGRGFIKYLKYYHAFVNVPSHFAYERIIEKENKEYFNQYFPFPHIREEGSFDHIMMFIKHIFGTAEVQHPKTKEMIPNYELGLDYLQILLMEPTQQLPIIVLYSGENQTGKSTFGELLYQMFADNVVFIGNKDLQSDFNEIFAGRLAAICEETQIERRQDAERIKNMSTAKRMTINPKGQKQYTIDFFTKFIFFSNHRRMVYITRHDDRYWIMQVPQPKTKDPELKVKMWAEVPAFINFLSQRKLRTKREARMHFLPELLQNQMFHDTVRVNEPSIATDLRIKIREVFFDQPELEELRMPLGNIIEEFLPSSTSRAYAMEILQDYLDVSQLRNEDGQLIQERGQYDLIEFNRVTEELEYRTVKWKGRPYVFPRKQFVKDDTVERKLEEGVEVPAETDDDWPFG